MIDTTMTASAPGKLILSGEYAVLDGAQALVIAIDRRVVARFRSETPRGSSPFLLELAAELGRRRGDDDPAARAALDIEVDSSALYDSAGKLGLGSSAAVTVAATALALGSTDGKLDRDEVFAIASAAHANTQHVLAASRLDNPNPSRVAVVYPAPSPDEYAPLPGQARDALLAGADRRARGSGADIAAAVHGGTLVFQAGKAERRTWPRSVHLLPFFTGASADTGMMIALITASRAAGRPEVEAALTAISDASRAACLAISAPADIAATGLIGAFALCAAAIDRLEAAAGLPRKLVPECVRAARSAMSRFGGTAKTTGAGGGDVAIAVIPATADVTSATRSLIEAGCRPLPLSVDETGVDLRAHAS